MSNINSLSISSELINSQSRENAGDLLSKLQERVSHTLARSNSVENNHAQTPAVSPQQVASLFNTAGQNCNALV